MSAPVAERVVAEALTWVGTPYRHQGRSKGIGSDCLGLLLGVWSAIYGRLPEEPGPYAPDWAEASGTEHFMEAAARHCVAKGPEEAAAPGDLLLFRWRRHLPAKHAGILIAPQRFVHAYEGGSVVVSTLVPQWRRRVAGVFSFPEP